MCCSEKLTLNWIDRTGISSSSTRTTSQSPSISKQKKLLNNFLFFFSLFFSQMLLHTNKRMDLNGNPKAQHSFGPKTEKPQKLTLAASFQLHFRKRRNNSPKRLQTSTTNSHQKPAPWRWKEDEFCLPFENILPIVVEDSNSSRLKLIVDWDGDGNYGSQMKDMNMDGWMNWSQMFKIIYIFGRTKKLLRLFPKK